MQHVSAVAMPAHFGLERYFLAGSVPESNHLWMNLEMQDKNIARAMARAYRLNI